MANETTNLHLTLTNDTDATTTTFKQWRESINGETDSNMQKIDAFAGTTNTALTDKVDKETGKGLSTNDFTNADKAKVDAIPADPKYTDTTYTAGEGINISDTNVISADITPAGNNTFTGKLNAFHGRVVVIREPTSANDVANKAYVDAHAGGGGDVTAAGNNTFTGTNTFKNESNFEGKVNIDDGITLIPKNVSTEEFLSISVDANEGTIAAVHTLATGGTAPKDISFAGSVLKELGTPVANTDAANKKYVDDHAIGNVTASATSIDSSLPATATATKSGNDISFAFGIPKGDPGNDYVLTDADKSEIAALVLAQIPDGDEVAYG